MENKTKNIILAIVIIGIVTVPTIFILLIGTQPAEEKTEISKNPFYGFDELADSELQSEKPKIINVATKLPDKVLYVNDFLMLNSSLLQQMKLSQPNPILKNHTYLSSNENGGYFKRSNGFTDINNILGVFNLTLNIGDFIIVKSSKSFDIVFSTNESWYLNLTNDYFVLFKPLYTRSTNIFFVSGNSFLIDEAINSNVFLQYYYVDLTYIPESTILKDLTTRLTATQIEITLQWNSVKNAFNYGIYRSTQPIMNSSISSLTTIAVLTSLTYTDIISLTSVVQKMYYVVSVINEFNFASISNEKSQDIPKLSLSETFESYPLGTFSTQGQWTITNPGEVTFDIVNINNDKKLRMFSNTIVSGASPVATYKFINPSTANPSLTNQYSMNFDLTLKSFPTAYEYNWFYLALLTDSDKKTPGGFNWYVVITLQQVGTSSNGTLRSYSSLWTDLTTSDGKTIVLMSGKEYTITIKMTDAQHHQVMIHDKSSTITSISQNLANYQSNGWNDKITYFSFYYPGSTNAKNGMNMFYDNIEASWL